MSAYDSANDTAARYFAARGQARVTLSESDLANVCEVAILDYIRDKGRS